ncbi:MAG: transcription termination factor NusA [Fibrobacteres bacterium]|nr:transcription termination factor NusA [Fibrobacterota bacterium]
MAAEIFENLNLIAKSKNLGPEVVVTTLQQSLINAAKKYLNLAKNIEAEIDKDTGDIHVYLRVNVVDDYPDVDPALTPEEVAAFDERYMLVAEAREYNEDAAAGDYLEMEIPIENFGRAAIQSAKQILLQKVRDAERDKIFEDYQHRIGTLVSGTVQQVDRGNILVNLGKTEGIIPLKEQIRKERYRQGDTIRAYIANVSTNTKGPQILLSRTHPEFLAELFKLEVPEIYDGIVQIKNVARDPGFRAKIAVTTKDDRIDPVGACVGMKGNRVQAIVRELSNERIDIIHWADDMNAYIRRALSPANIKQISDIGDGRAVVIVGDEDLSQAIGRGGQNVRLASKLIGKELDIYGQTEFGNMPPEDKEALFKPREGVKIPGTGETAAPVTAAVPSKFSELESLFSKKKPEGESEAL